MTPSCQNIVITIPNIQGVCWHHWHQLREDRQCAIIIIRWSAQKMTWADDMLAIQSRNKCRKILKFTDKIILYGKTYGLYFEIKAKFGSHIWKPYVKGKLYVKPLCESLIWKIIWKTYHSVNQTTWSLKLSSQSLLESLGPRNVPDIPPAFVYMRFFFVSGSCV